MKAEKLFDDTKVNTTICGIMCGKQRVTWGNERTTLRNHKTPGVKVRGVVKYPSFYGETIWSNYRRQFMAAAVCNRWTSPEKATVLLLEALCEASLSWMKWKNNLYFWAVTNN